MDRILAELEAAVRTSWSYDDLVVYADHLQATGDLRGELMALDLSPPADRNTADARPWRERRRALIAQWVGGGLAELVDEVFELGFIKELPAEAPLAVWDSPAGDCVRAATISAVEVAAVGARPRPWLARVAMRGAADAEALAAFAAATPNLVTVELDASSGVFAHPTVRRAKLAHAPVVGAPLPSVTHLAIEAVAVFPVRGADFPACRDLDLTGVTGGNQGAVLRALAGSLASTRIGTVALPALFDDEAALGAAAFLDRCPHLTHVTIARGHGGGAVYGRELAARFPRLVVPEPFPWPAFPKTSVGIATLTFRLPEEPFDDVVELAPLIEHLEARFDAMPEDARDAWTQIFELVRPADPNTGYDEDTGEWYAEPVRPPVTLGVVARAADACAELSSRSWEHFRTHLADARRGLSAAAPVILAMYRR